MKKSFNSCFDPFFELAKEVSKKKIEKLGKEDSAKRILKGVREVEKEKFNRMKDIFLEPEKEPDNYDIFISMPFLGFIWALMEELSKLEFTTARELFEYIESSGVDINYISAIDILIREYK